MESEDIKNIELEEIRNKIIEVAIKDYNDPAYNVLNTELLENVLFVLERTKGTSLYTKEQAQLISADIRYWISLRNQLFSCIGIAKGQQEINWLDPMNIHEMNVCKNKLLRATSSTIEDFYASNSHLEEVQWLKSMENQPLDPLRFTDIINEIQKEFLNYQKDEEYANDFIRNVSTLLNSCIISSNDRKRINDVLYECYAKISNEKLKKLHDAIEKVYALIKKDEWQKDKDELNNTISTIEIEKQQLELLTEYIKGIEPNFTLADLFEYNGTYEYLIWYEEYQKFTKEEIIQTHLKSTSEDDNIVDKMDMYILATMNESTEKVIYEFEKGKDNKKEHMKENDVALPQKPKDKGFEEICQNYADRIREINRLIADLDKNYEELLKLEPKIIEEIRTGRAIDKQTNTPNPGSSLVAFFNTFTNVKMAEGTIQSLKKSLRSSDMDSYMQYKCFPFEFLEEELQKPQVTTMDIDKALQDRKETIEELKLLYDNSDNELERNTIKGIIVSEQGIMTSEILRQEFEPYFGKSFLLRRYRTDISFEEKTPEIKEPAEKREPDKKRKQEKTSKVSVKELKLNFKEVQSAGPNAFVLKEEDTIKISIAKNKLIIAFNKALRTKLNDARYDLEFFQRQNANTEKIPRETKVIDDIEMWSYDLTHIDTTEFYLTIIIKDLIDSNKNKKYSLIKKGVLEKHLLNGEIDRTILAR